MKLFSENIVHVFCSAFESSDVSTRIAMQHLLKTWYGVFPVEKLDEIHDKIKLNAPFNNNDPPRQGPHGIHVNPRYLTRGGFPEVRIRIDTPYHTHCLLIIYT